MMQLTVVVKFTTTARVITGVLTINQNKLLLKTPWNSKNTFSSTRRLYYLLYKQMQMI